MNIELPESVTVNFAFNLGEQEIDLSNKSVEWIMWALAFGLRQSVKDACAGKANTLEGETALAAKFNKVCVQGLIPSSGRGLASGTSLDDRVGNKFLSQMGIKGKMGALAERWASFARVTILNSVDAETKAILQKDLTQLSELAAEYLKAVKESARETPEWAKIKAELTEPKVAKPTLGVKITVGPLKGLVQLPEEDE